MKGLDHHAKQFALYSVTYVKFGEVFMEGGSLREITGRLWRVSER